MEADDYMKRKYKIKKNIGRPTLLTPKLREEIVKMLKAGNYIETVCALVGINKSTFYKWLKKADESTRSTKYSKFRDAVEKAKAIAEARDVAILAKHCETNWKAAKWKLERRYPNKWGKPKFRSVTS